MISGETAVKTWWGSLVCFVAAAVGLGAQSVDADRPATDDHPAVVVQQSKGVDLAVYIAVGTGIALGVVGVWQRIQDGTIKQLRGDIEAEHRRLLQSEEARARLVHRLADLGEFGSGTDLPPIDDPTPPPAGGKL